MNQLNLASNCLNVNMNAISEILTYVVYTTRYINKRIIELFLYYVFYL